MKYFLLFLFSSCLYAIDLPDIKYPDAGRLIYNLGTWNSCNYSIYENAKVFEDENCVTDAMVNYCNSYPSPDVNNICYQGASIWYGSIYCPDGTVVSNNGDDSFSCVCPDGLELVSFHSCPLDENSTDDVPMSCEPPCPEGTFRNQSGGCCPMSMVQFCDTSTHTFKCRCPYDSVSDDLNSSVCLKCDNSYPNFDSSDCSVCPPYYEDNDGLCVNTPCMDDFPFYYPVSETSQYGFTNDSAGNSVTCYNSGDNNSTGTDSDSSNTSDTNSSDSNISDSGDSSGSSTSGTFDDTNLINQLRENKTVIEGVKTSVDSVKSSVDGVKTSVDNLKNSVDQGNQKLDRIADLLDSNVSFSFSDLTGQMQDAFTSIQSKIDTAKQTFDNARSVLETGKTYHFQGGNFNGFHLTVWDEQIDFDPCPMLIKLAPFMTMIVQFMFVLWSFFIMLWGFKR